MQLKDMIAVMQAAERGEAIQISDPAARKPLWTDITHPQWDWITCRYRVKPTPQYGKELWLSFGADSNSWERASYLTQRAYNTAADNFLKAINKE